MFEEFIDNLNRYTMATITQFEDLDIWKFAREICQEIDPEKSKNKLIHQIP